MRLKSELWVKAYLRRLTGEGVFAAVMRRGHDDAGAIYIKLATLDGFAVVFAPAPMGFETVAEERQWISYFGDEQTSEKDADAYLSQQSSYDSDIWVVEVEDRKGRHFMDDWLARS